jgi:hypothetical protein
MQGLYEKYVRLGYYERRHPVRYGALLAIPMAALLWAITWRTDSSGGESATNALQFAVVYSFGFCAIRILMSRSQRQRDRFDRWAARHPEPQVGDQPVAHSAAPPPGSLHGVDRLAWLGWTLLTAFGVYLLVGILFTALFGPGPQNGAVVAVIVAVLSMPAAIYLRLNWPPVRDWKSRT